MIRELTGVQRLGDDVTVDDIRKSLQLAIEIEHATIPAYLTAFFSLHDGTNPDAGWVLRTVATEEMLHMALAANVLNAIGGTPTIDDPGFIPEYPFTLPFVDPPTLHVAGFSLEAVLEFMQVERNWDPAGPPPPGQYATIGEFYRDIIAKLEQLAAGGDIFTGDPARQVGPDDYYGSEGRLVEVHDLTTARDALELIIDQGEGAGPPPTDVDGFFAARPGTPRGAEAHYVAHLYRFSELAFGAYYNAGQSPHPPPNLRNTLVDVAVEAAVTDDPRQHVPVPDGPALRVDWQAVWPVVGNVEADRFPVGSAPRTALDRFNQAYSDLLRTLERTFDGRPGDLKDTVPAMYELMYLGQQLCRIPLGDGVHTVGPSWEYLPAS